MADLLRRVRELLLELKRRRVYRVVVAYVVVAAGALQLVDVVIPSTRLPGWTDELFLGLAVVGFPLAVVLAWAFDVTPDGVRRTPAEPGEGKPVAEPGGSGPPSRSPAPTEDVEEDPGRGPGPPEEGAGGIGAVRRVAVLPFENLSGSDAAEPFTAGLHDDLLTELSKISALTVISRTSVRRYRDSDKSVLEVARELGVGTVVEGGVQQAGERVRLNVQLIDARSDVHRWAERYDRKLSAESIFEIQAELAEKIAHTLRAELAPGEQERLGRTATADLQAYRHYARGRSGVERRTEEGARNALAEFRSAIERDPQYALAWAGVAYALALSRYYGYALPEEGPDAMEAARTALELAPDLGEPHASLGILHALRHEGDRAREELERAVELKPSDSEAHSWLGWLNLVQGRPIRARKHLQRSAELDPHGPAMRAFLADALLANGEARHALSHARAGRELEPGYGLPHFVEGLVLYHLGRLAEAGSALTRALSLVPPEGVPSHAQIRAVQAVVHAARGDDEEAGRLLERIEDEADFASAGLVRAALGDVEGAFEAWSAVELWESFSTESVRYFFPRILEPVRADPRYRTLVGEVDRSWRSGARGDAPGSG